MQEIDTWSFYSNPVKRDTDGDSLSDLDDLAPTKYDTVVVEEMIHLLCSIQGEHGTM